MPLKDLVRKAERIDVGDTVTVGGVRRRPTRRERRRARHRPDRRLALLQLAGFVTDAD